MNAPHQPDQPLNEALLSVIESLAYRLKSQKEADSFTLSVFNSPKEIMISFQAADAKGKSVSITQPFDIIVAERELNPIGYFDAASHHLISLKKE